MKQIEWATPGKASVLVDGQFGSTGKGLAAAWLAECVTQSIGIATCNAGANAGHTTRYSDGRKFVCFHLPTTGVVRRFRGENTLCYVNAGSIIDPDVLFQEIKACGLHPDDVIIHPRAAIITQSDCDVENEKGSGTVKTASTAKGVGSALTNKIMRRAQLAGDVLAGSIRIETLDLGGILNSIKPSIVVEVPQGMDLSLNHGEAYPYTTSRDCLVGNGLADAGIHPSFCGPVCMVVRTYPIRVGHRYENEMGEKIGDSGPFAAGSIELDWAKDFPDVEPERTTVTKRVRRIATWSDSQYRKSLLLSRPTLVFVNFLNYLRNQEEFAVQMDRMYVVEHELGIHPTHVYGFGACVEDVTTVFEQAVAWYERRSF